MIITHYFARLRNTPSYMILVLNKSVTRVDWGRYEWGSVTTTTRFDSSYMMWSFAEGLDCESGVLLYILPSLIPLTLFFSKDVGILTFVRETLFVLWLDHKGSCFESLFDPWLGNKAFKSQCKQHSILLGGSSCYFFVLCT